MSGKYSERSWKSGAVFASIGRAMDHSLIASVRAAERILLPRGTQNYYHPPPPPVYQVPYGYSVQHTPNRPELHPASYGQYAAPPGPYEPPPPYSGPAYPKTIGCHPPPPYQFP